MPIRTVIIIWVSRSFLHIVNIFAFWHKRVIWCKSLCTDTKFYNRRMTCKVVCDFETITTLGLTATWRHAVHHRITSYASIQHYIKLISGEEIIFYCYTPCIILLLVAVTCSCGAAWLAGCCNKQLLLCLWTVWPTHEIFLKTIALPYQFSDSYFSVL